MVLMLLGRIPAKPLISYRQSAVICCLMTVLRRSVWPILYEVTQLSLSLDADHARHNQPFTLTWHLCNGLLLSAILLSTNALQPCSEFARIFSHGMASATYLGFHPAFPHAKYHRTWHMSISIQLHSNFLL
jgi:hypothetical protein